MRYFGSHVVMATILYHAMLCSQIWISELFKMIIQFGDNTIIQLMLNEKMQNG